VGFFELPSGEAAKNREIQPEATFDLTNNPGSERLDSNPRMQIAVIFWNRSFHIAVLALYLNKNRSTGARMPRHDGSWILASNQ
jgi:hypothetical protein